MSLQDLGSNYPEGHPGNCIHGMTDDGLNCLQCACTRAGGHIGEVMEIVDFVNDEYQKNPGNSFALIDDNLDDIKLLIKSILTFVNSVDPEIESWKRVVTKITHEKGIFESRCSYYETGLKLIVKNCIDCPDTASFASHLLDGTVQLHTESVCSWDKDCDECHGMGFIKGWIYNNNQEIPCPKCFKRQGEDNGEK